MNVSELYKTTVYEVLSENTQKYTSTTVSGGGGHVSSHNGNVSTNISPVTSKIHHHSDQTLWVKNVETGEEEKFQFTTFNIDVRPGHKILCARNMQTNRFERIVNLDTHKVFAEGGIYNDRTGVGKSLSTFKGRLFNSVFKKLSWLPAIPFLNAFHALIALYQHILLGKGVWWDERLPNSRKHGLFIIALDGALLYWAVDIIGRYRIDASDWVLYILGAVTSLILLDLKIASREFATIKTHSDSLDAWLVEDMASKQLNVVPQKAS